MKFIENISTGKISTKAFKKVTLLSILIIVGYAFFTIIFINNSSVFDGISNFLLPIISAVTLIMVYYAVKRSKTYGKSYYHAWLFLLIAQAFWVMGDILWSIWNSKLTDPSFLTYGYVCFGFRIVFLCISLYLMPKPHTDILNLYRRLVEICMVLVTLTMFFWSFLILPFIGRNQIDSVDLTVIWLNIILISALMFFTIYLFVSYAGNLKKGPMPYIIVSVAFQVLATITFAYGNILGAYSIGMMENLFWIAACLCIILASLVQIRCHPPEVLKDLSIEYWRFKIPFETNVALLLGGVAYILLIWAYFSFESVFEVLLFGGGLLIGLALIRAAISNKEVRKSYAKLEESKKTYQCILNTINDAVYVINPEIKFLEVNQGALDMYGYSRQEILGKSLDMLSAPGKNDMTEVVNTGYRALDGETQTFEFWGMRKNGEIFPKEIKINKGTYFGHDVVVAVARDITNRKEYEKTLKKSLAEKEVMVQEVHHRVKNNMQVISSLLRLQSMYLDNEKVKNALQESQNRVQSMAMVHEKLYQSKDLSSVDLEGYLHQIMRYLLDNYKMEFHQIKTVIRAEKAEIDVKTASPLGLIVNELITNSLKYAFPEGKGEITLNVCLVGDYYHLTVADDGIGLPDDFQLDRTETLGLQLVNRLVGQIDGFITLGEGKGTKFVIKFPANNQKRGKDN
ncbi:sensor histidine kinase [Methanobacterium petrolearium]|uniref:sensor histidine kinase n=1 Tax=Methanobacterium petrolearium TaxID=710190 RepID=UPI001AEA3AC5|nr:histidine kinase dimerization/phosphoacceptor domain -containing protein [Methanobacterium petrolearium]MBP1946905.1 PAS domain S-box-containing protein [Methanobacterium petrolearium]